MKFRSVLVIALIGSLVLGAGESSAQGKGKSKGKGGPPSSAKGNSGKGSSTDKGSPAGKGPGNSGKKEQPATGRDDGWRSEAKFRDRDRSDLESLWGDYSKNPRGLPPGLAKNLRRGKPLPPGWDKKLRSGWIVEDDWWGLFDRVPGDYLPRDFRLPKDTGMYLFGDRIVRVHEPTREVLDLVRIATIKP